MRFILTHAIVRYLLIIIVIIVGAIVFMRRESLQKRMMKLTPTPTVKIVTDEESDITFSPSVALTQAPLIDRAIPWIEPVLEDDVPLKSGDTFSIELQAFSGSKDVTGYDILFSYDRSLFDFVSVKSSLSQYQVYHYERGSYIAITGIKKLEENNPIIFDQTRLVTIEMKVKKQGIGTVLILPESGKEKTQFVDAQVHPYLPQSGKLIVEVE